MAKVFTQKSNRETLGRAACLANLRDMWIALSLKGVGHGSAYGKASHRIPAFGNSPFGLNHGSTNPRVCCGACVRLCDWNTRVTNAARRSLSRFCRLPRHGGNCFLRHAVTWPTLRPTRPSAMRWNCPPHEMLTSKLCRTVNL